MADSGTLINWGLLAIQPPGWGGVLLNGLWRTIEISVGGYTLGVFLGIGGAVGKLYGGPVIRDVLEVYTTLVRAVPELVLMLILYYAGTDLLNQASSLMGFGHYDVSGLAAGIFVIGVVQGAYSTEVLRGAIKAVHVGQIEAARAFGMSPLRIMHRVTLPAMLPHALPGLSNLWLTATKATSLLAVVGFSELTLVTRQAAGSTKSYLLFFCAAGVLYLALTLASNVVVGVIERRSRRSMARPA